MSEDMHLYSLAPKRCSTHSNLTHFPVPKQPVGLGVSESEPASCEVSESEPRPNHLHQGLGQCKGQKRRDLKGTVEGAATHRGASHHSHSRVPRGQGGHVLRLR